MTMFDMERVRQLQHELAEHPIYESLQTLADLQVFMTHHVFSVWDFMSLTKYLQQQLTPIEIPWIPSRDPELRYFINQLILDEESDQRTDKDGRPVYASHFECYCDAMTEIGADGKMPAKFIDMVRKDGVDAALYSDLVPLPARYFCETTFALIREDKPHQVAAAFALGREQIVPEMFRRFLREMRITETQAPTFSYYLERHIEIDQDFHGPLALRLLEKLCGDDPEKIEEAETAAEESICARIRFWDGVLDAIKSRYSNLAA
jgi:hypothetical protein